jgi:hypothetical protein
VGTGVVVEVMMTVEVNTPSPLSNPSTSRSVEQGSAVGDAVGVLVGGTGVLVAPTGVLVATTGVLVLGKVPVGVVVFVEPAGPSTILPLSVLVPPFGRRKREGCPACAVPPTSITPVTINNISKPDNKDAFNILFRMAPLLSNLAGV